MKRASIKWVFLATLTLGFVSVEPAMAQRRGGFLAQLFGNGQNARSQPAISTNQRRINRAVQTALNFFEFDAGTVDGIFGRKSRAAASAFQAFMGYEETGRLTREENDFLLTSFNEIANKDEALALKVSLGLVSAQDLLKTLAEGEVVVADIVEETLQDGPLSMRGTCVNIGASLSIDLLKAQFCNLRQLAIEQGDFLMKTSLSGQLTEPLVGECRLFSLEMQPEAAKMVSANSEDIISEMGLWVRRSGVSDEKLAQLSETCLGVAYKHDDAEAALAALLVLSGLKNAIHIELTGYHVALGLGVAPADFARAQGWMEAAVAAQLEGNVALTAQSSAQRTDVLVDVISILSTRE